MRPAAHAKIGSTRGGGPATGPETARCSQRRGVTLAALAFVQRQQHQQQQVWEAMQTRALVLGLPMPTDLRLCALGVYGAPRR